jgi:hypothetical protein
MLTEGVSVASMYVQPCLHHLRNAYNVQSSLVVTSDDGRPRWHQRQIRFWNAVVHIASRRGFLDNILNNLRAVVHGKERWRKCTRIFLSQTVVDETVVIKCYLLPQAIVDIGKHQDGLPLVWLNVIDKSKSMSESKLEEETSSVLN